MPSAQVHRFRETVAAYLGAGPTTYLTPREARALARALNRAARSCMTEDFTASTCGTVTVALAGTDAHTAGEAAERERRPRRQPRPAPGAVRYITGQDSLGARGPWNSWRDACADLGSLIEADADARLDETARDGGAETVAAALAQAMGEVRAIAADVPPTIGARAVVFMGARFWAAIQQAPK